MLTGEYVIAQSRIGGPYLMVTLNPPHNYLKVLRCPNFLKIIRAVAAGASVACLECGFPNKIDMYR